MNIHFWIWVHDGPVKLTLRPGQTLRHHISRRHDEGWSSEDNAWNWDGKELTRNWCMDGTDCDGRLTRTGCDRAARVYGIRDFNEDHLHGQVIHYPEWMELETRQRDYFAEAANY